MTRRTDAITSGVCSISLPSSSRRTLLAAMTGASLMSSSAAHGAAAGVSSTNFTPEQFGAKGDGVTDDASAIQRALDAAAATPSGHGLVILQPRQAYRCDHGLIMDCSRTSLSVYGLLDFSRHSGTCLQVNASSVAAPLTPANNYGRHGTIGGALRVRGGGNGRTAIGLRFDSDAEATAAQLLVENLAISGCTIGVQFARRAYNNVFIRCEIFDCGTCVHWLDAEDNGERNTLIGCVLYNSDIAVRLEQSSGALYLNNCSIDYTRILYDVARGIVFATDCHHESSRWADRPIRARHDGSVVNLTGGIVLGQADPLPTDHMAEIGSGARVRIDGTFVHNLILRPEPGGIATWATGAGTITATRLDSFTESRLPQRLHVATTGLSDPDFAAPDWQDPVWRLVSGAAPITSRHGKDGEALVLRRSDEGLSVIRHGRNLPARFALLSLSVRAGEEVLAGFRVRRRTGEGLLGISPNWARIDGYDAALIPVVTRLDSTGVLEIAPGDRFQSIGPLATRPNRVAPPWATHFLLVIDVSRVEGEILFRGLWGDVVTG